MPQAVIHLPCIVPAHHHAIDRFQALTRAATIGEVPEGARISTPASCLGGAHADAVTAGRVIIVLVPAIDIASAGPAGVFWLTGLSRRR